MNIDKIVKAGGRIITTKELVTELQKHVAKNPSSAVQVNRLISAITQVEGEVLIEGRTPEGSARRLSASHNSYVKASEKLWERFNAKQVTRAELEAGLTKLEGSYKSTRTVGRVGRVFMVAGIAFTVVDLANASNRSIEQSSFKPIAAETIRQTGGWTGAIAGAKIGALAGAALGIETGPGAIITGAVGAVIFGAAGYFSADWIADFIDEN
jgi:phage tail tape-measure protein